MDDEAYVRLVREIETEKGRMTAHEGVCAERYKTINETLIRIETAQTASKKAVSSWRDKALYALVSVLFAFGCWAAGQLWHQEPMRVAEERPQ